MSNVYFISDLHFGHRNICKYRPEFETEEQHRHHIMENWCNTVRRKKDTVWVLGDSIFEPQHIKDIQALPGIKKLVQGNHCLQNYDRRLLWECFDDVLALVPKYGCWLTHAPIHTDELRGKLCVHGHTHHHIIDDPRYINMCVEHHDYTPRNLVWLRSTINERTKVLLMEQKARSEKQLS